MADTGFNFADTVGLGVINTGLSFLSSLAQKKMNEDSAIKMNELYYSPRAQAANLAAAGINPAVAFGNNAPVFHNGSSLGSVSAPTIGIGTTSLSDLATYIKSVADAKKAGVDTELSEQEIRIKEIERQSKEFELELKKYFGASELASKIALAWSDVALKQDEHSINEWKKVSAEAVAKADEHQRDILKKVLDNKDTELELSNELLRQKSATEKSQQASNFSQASVNHELRRINKVLADIEEGAKDEKLLALISEYQAKNLISDADAVEARLKVGRLHDQREVRNSDSFMRGLDDILEYLKDKVSIFKSK